MSDPVSPPLAGVLRSGRPAFNARYVEMKRRRPDLDPAAFAAVLRTMVDPLVVAVHAIDPGRVPPLVWAAYDAALVVVAEKLSGPSGRHTVIAEAWANLLPAIAPLLAVAPRRVIGAVTNALCQLASTPGIRADQWTERLRAVSVELTTLEVLLAAGQVAAWRCGLAHYREGALAVADTLPPAVALRLLDAPSGAAWPEVRARLANERWWDPAQATNPAAWQVVRSAGGFRGFGGLFIEPPVVAASEAGIFVRSGEGHWLLTADAFGATFHRAEAAEFEAALDRKTPPPLLKRPLPELGEITSAAATADTVVVTGTLTHAITLLALA